MEKELGAEILKVKVSLRNSLMVYLFVNNSIQSFEFGFIIFCNTEKCSKNPVAGKSKFSGHVNVTLLIVFSKNLHLL